MYEIIEINGKRYAKGLLGYYEVDEEGRIRFDKRPINLTSLDSSSNKETKNENKTSSSDNNNIGWGYSSVSGDTITFDFSPSSSSSSDWGYTSTSGESVTFSFSSNNRSSSSSSDNNKSSKKRDDKSSGTIGYTSITGKEVEIDLSTGKTEIRNAITGEKITEPTESYVFISYSDSSSKKFKPIGGVSTITGEEVYIYEEMGRKPKEIVDKYLSSDWKEAIITSIPIVGQIWHAYETKKATEELEKYLKYHPEEAEYVYKELERLRKEKLKQLLGDTAFHGAMILVPALAGARFGIIAGKIAGSPLTKTALQGALIGGATGFMGETGRQSINVAFGDKFNVNQVLLSTGIGAGLGALLGAGIYKFATRTGRYHWVSDKSVVKDIDIENIRVKRFGNQIIYSGGGKANVEYYVQTRKGLQPIGTKTEPYHFSGRSYVINANQIADDIIQNVDDDVLTVLQNIQRTKSLVKIEGTGFIGKQRFEAEFYGYQKGFISNKYSPEQLRAIERFEEQLSKLHPKFKEITQSNVLMQYVKESYPEYYANIENYLIQDIAGRTKQFATQIVGYGNNIKQSGIYYGRFIGRIRAGRNVYYTSAEEISFNVGNEQISFIKGLSNQGREFIGKLTLYGRSGLQYGRAYYKDPLRVLESIEKVLPKIENIKPKPSILFPSTIVNELSNIGLSLGIGLSSGIASNIASQSIQSNKESQSLIINVVQSVRQIFENKRIQIPSRSEEYTKSSPKETTFEESYQQQTTSTNQQTEQQTSQTVTEQIIQTPEPQPKPQQQLPPPIPYIPPEIPALPYPPFLGIVGSFAGQSKQIQQNINYLVNEIVYSVRRLF